MGVNKHDTVTAALFEMSGLKGGRWSVVKPGPRSQCPFIKLTLVKPGEPVDDVLPEE